MQVLIVIFQSSIKLFIKSRNKHIAGIEPGGFYSVEIIKEAVKMELDMKQQ